MKITMRLRVILFVLLFAGVKPAWSQSSSEIKAPRPLADRMLQYLPGYHSPQSALRTEGATQDAVVVSKKAKVYAFATADFPGAAESVVYDANASTIVGYCEFDPSSVPSTPQIAFTLKGGVYQMLAVPNAVASFATGINTSGQIVGAYTDSSSVAHGYLDIAGTFTNIDYPSSTGTEPLEINDSGMIVGSYADATSAIHGYLDNAGTFSSFDYPGATATYATGINSSGEIVGYWQDSSYNVYGFIYNGSVFTSLNVPLGTGTTPFGVNDKGEVAGFYQDATSLYHGFIYTGGAFSEVDVFGAVGGTQLSRIKNSGAITGVFIDALTEAHGIKGH